MVGRWQYNKMVWLHNLVLCGMRHLVITMMLLLGSTMIQIQVLLFVFHFPPCSIASYKDGYEPSLYDFFIFFLLNLFGGFTGRKGSDQITYNLSNY